MLRTYVHKYANLSEKELTLEDMILNNKPNQTTNTKKDLQQIHEGWQQGGVWKETSWGHRTRNP